MPGKEAMKAYVGAALAAVAAGLAVLFTALDDNSITAQEWVGVASAVIASLVAVFGGVYLTPNKGATYRG
jgi:hypothetical protein